MRLHPDFERRSHRPAEGHDVICSSRLSETSRFGFSSGKARMLMTLSHVDQVLDILYVI